SVSAAVSCPVLCKDFIVDTTQIFAARHAGADAVLLIVKILDADSLTNLYTTTRELGMTPVLEVQAETELVSALQLQPEILLINNRNLETFEIDLATTARLASLIPPGIPFISASGISTRNDI